MTDIEKAHDCSAPEQLPRTSSQMAAFDAQTAHSTRGAAYATLALFYQGEAAKVGE